MLISLKEKKTKKRKTKGGADFLVIKYFLTTQ